MSINTSPFCSPMLSSFRFLMPWLLLVFAPLAVGEERLFPFVVSYDNPVNATNLSSWLPKPAGKDGFLRVANGQFVNEAGRVRFWGVNLCFDACFPTHERADRVAQRLARLGINVVRMHHMDSRSIWGNSPNKLTIDARQLERLDYLIWQLKRNGIYTNLNLHVSRSLGPAEGFPAPAERPRYDKGLDNFEPRMIELQKKYARDLLTHVNPYTGLAYAKEPAVAFVEINNENALFHQWSRGELDSLPAPYAATFREQWSAWLARKYRATDQLRVAWSEGEQPLGREMLDDGAFTKPLGAEWNLERDDPADAAWNVQSTGPDGAPCLRVEVKRQGREAWRPQFSRSGLALQKGQAYTLTFVARVVGTSAREANQERSDERAAAPPKIGLNCMMAHEPWRRLGLSASADIGPRWTRRHFTFVAERDDDNARIPFPSLPPETYEFTTISLRPGGVVGLQPDERLEDRNIAVLGRGQSSRTPAARRDFIDFLWDTENAYWTDMHRFLKKELGVQALVSGTQLGYSPVHIQAQLDYIDAHAYWQHPRFPNRPWDRDDWYLEDAAMVNSPGGTLTRLAARRVAGLPFTVSEYNHPTPNSYEAEGLPMLAAMAAHQGWDGVYSFAYSHDEQFEPDRLTGYFDIKSNPAKLVHMPASVALFVRGDLAAARQSVLAPLSRQAERNQLLDTGDPGTLTMGAFGVDENLSLLRAVAFDLTAKASLTSRLLTPGAKEYLADTGMMRWGVAAAGRGVFVVNTPRTKLFTGFVPDEAIDLGDVQLRIGATKLNWATLSLTCLDGDGFSRPGRILIAASGYQQNTDAVLEHLGGQRISLHSQWGRGPVLCEGIPAEITLPVSAERVTCYALDAAGNRRHKLACQSEDAKTRLRLEPRHATLWYEVLVDL